MQRQCTRPVKSGLPRVVAVIHYLCKLVFGNAKSCPEQACRKYDYILLSTWQESYLSLTHAYDREPQKEDLRYHMK